LAALFLLEVLDLQNPSLRREQAVVALLAGREAAGLF